MIQIKKNTLIFIIIASLVVGMVATVLFVKSDIGDSVLVAGDVYEQLESMAKRYSKLETVRLFIEDKYYQPLDDAVIMEGAYRGMMSAAGDDYTYYISADELDEFYESMMGTATYGGVGITFLTTSFENGFYITSVNAQGPAYDAGIRKGGYIISVNGRPFTEFDGDQLSNEIRGEIGTDVKVEIKDLNGIKEYTLTRREIPSYSVEITIESLENGKNCAVISISQFIASTQSEFEWALNIAENQADYMVLDLRDCPGGLVDPAVKIADMLMDEGVIITTQEQDGTGLTYSSAKGRTKLPFAILVNENTASAAEILSCAVQDNEEGIIVGKTTYGKGIIQNTWPLSDGSALKYTESQYMTATGKPIHKIGVTPDYEVELDEECYNEEGLLFFDKQLQKAFEILIGKE